MMKITTAKALCQVRGEVVHLREVIIDLLPELQSVFILNALGDLHVFVLLLLLRFLVIVFRLGIAVGFRCGSVGVATGTSTLSLLSLLEAASNQMSDAESIDYRPSLL